MTRKDQHTDYYEVLGVLHDASEKAVRRSYYKLVRKHPPNKDPEGFQRIKLAYDTLADPGARRNYDSLWQYGDDIRHIMEAAYRSIQCMDYEEGARLLKRALVLNPEAYEARDLLGICQVELGELDEALQTYGKLTEKKPEVPLYWQRYGQVYIKLAEDCDFWKRSHMLASARSQFLRANEIDSINTAPYLSIAKTYLLEKQHDEALSWVERAVIADESVDFQDFDALFYMCHIHALAGNAEKILEVARRIESLVTDDLDIRLYVGTQFAKAAFELLEIKVFEAAKYFLRAAAKFDPINTDLRDLQTKVEHIVEAKRMWPKLEKDPDIIAPVKSLAALTYLNFSGQYIVGGYEKAAESIRTSFSGFPPYKIRASIVHLKENYAWFYNFAPVMWDKLHDTISHVEKHIPVKSGSLKYGYAIGSARSGRDQSPSNTKIVGYGILFALIGAALGSFFFFPVGVVLGSITGWFAGTQVARSL